MEVDSSPVIQIIDTYPTSSIRSDRDAFPPVSCLGTANMIDALEVKVAISVLCGLAPQMPMRRLSEALSMETFVIARSLRVFEVRAKTGGMV